MEMIEHALEYLRRGWSVIPLRPRDKKPALSSWKEYQTRRATEEEVREWWTKWPQANIGIATGSVSGIIVLDVDGEEGRESLKEVAGSDIPLTPHTNTGKGNHYLFRHPGGEWRNFAGKLPGLDFRGDGGYIVAPPSVHPSGRQYEWAVSPEEAELADPPVWLMDLLTKKQESESAADAPRANVRPQASAGADMILANCAFCQHCRDTAETLSEPEWYAMISNLARAEGGKELIHELSRPYPGYSPAETDLKIEHALKDGEPHTCAYIQDNLGFTGCPAGGCGVKAPIGFVSSPVVAARLTVQSVITRLEANPDQSSIYADQDTIGSLAILKKQEPAEYARIKKRFKELCGRNINLNDLERVVNKKIAENQKLRIADPDDPPPSLSELLPEMTNRELRRPHAWTLNENGIWQDTRFGPVCACPVPVLLTKRLHNIDTGEEKVELSFYRDGSWKHVVANRSTVFNRTSLISLADKGLPVSSESVKHLVRYLTDFERENLNLLPLKRSISRMGWVGSRTFIPGAGGDVELDVDTGGSQSIASGYREEGTLDEWVAAVKPIRKYPIARFVLSASFAAPLLRIVNQRVFIIHSWGPSRSGKTAALKTALSVWGEPEEIMANFNATKVGMERLAAFYSDLPLGIDERQVVGDRHGFVESLVYLLGLGKGKARGAKGGGLQQFQSWRTIALTTGEEPLSSDSSTAGIKTRALELYGVPIPNEKLASEIHQVVGKNFGIAGPAFIRQVLHEMEQNSEVFKTDFNAIQNELTEMGSENLSSHVAAVSLVCMADYYVSKWIFGMSDDEAYSQAIGLAQSVMGQLETATEADDGTRAYEYLMSWYQVNEWAFEDDTPRERYGRIRNGFIHIYPTIFEKVMRDGGFNPNRILRDWADRGWLETEIKPSEGKRRLKVRRYDLDEKKVLYFYSIKLMVTTEKVTT